MLSAAPGFSIIQNLHYPQGSEDEAGMRAPEILNGSPDRFSGIYFEMNYLAYSLSHLQNQAK